MEILLIILGWVLNIAVAPLWEHEVSVIYWPIMIIPGLAFTITAGSFVFGLVFGVAAGIIIAVSVLGKVVVTVGKDGFESLARRVNTAAQGGKDGSLPR